MTKEALKLALEALEPLEFVGKRMVGGNPKIDEAIIAIKEALAQPEPVKIAHKHEWFRTGEMKVGQMRCISCGTWGQEEMPQRTWVGLTDEEIKALASWWPSYDQMPALMVLAKDIQNSLKEKNT